MSIQNCCEVLKRKERYTQKRKKYDHCRVNNKPQFVSKQNVSIAAVFLLQMDPRLLATESAMEVSSEVARKGDHSYIPSCFMRELQEEHKTPVLSLLTAQNVQILCKERHDIMERFMKDVIGFMRDTNENNLLAHYSVLFTEAGCSIATPKNCEDLGLFYTK